LADRNLPSTSHSKVDMDALQTMRTVAMAENETILAEK